MMLHKWYAGRICHFSLYEHPEVSDPSGVIVEETDDALVVDTVGERYNSTTEKHEWYWYNRGVYINKAHLKAVYPTKFGVECVHEEKEG